MSPSTPAPLGHDELSPPIDISKLGFETTAEIEAERSHLGGARALSALRLGARLRTPGYNIFITGLEGSGKDKRLRKLIEKEAEGLPTPPDLVYLNNFDDFDRPIALALQPGQGRQFRRDMEGLVSDLRRQIPAALQKEGFEREKEQITSSYDQQLKDLFSEFQDESRRKGVQVQMSPDGKMAFVPLKENGEPVANQEEFESLSAERKKELDANRDGVQRQARELAKQQQEIARKVRDEVEGAVKKFAAAIVDPLVASISERYGDEGLKNYLEKVKTFVLENLEDFQESREQGPAFPFMMPSSSPEEKFLPYRVNLIVDNSTTKGAPVVTEDNPTYQNLFGSIERMVDQTGKLVTNFTRIKAGGLLRSNGGFLIFDIDDALTEIMVWKPLKRVLKCGRIEIESQNPFAFFTVSGMTPESIEVDTRLVVTGSRYAYSLLSSLDPDFRDIFKVWGDFAPEEKRNDDSELAYARRVAHLAAEEGLLHFTSRGVEELLLFGVRRAGDRDKLSAHLNELDDLVREASMIASENNADLADETHVRQAMDQRIFRANWIEERSRELYKQGTLLLDVEGEAVGQINGLSVLMFGSYSFGRPTRLTASVSMGNAGIVNIEREAKMSGSTHDKGVLIIAGFMRNRFGQNKPLSFSASLCFEQSYSGVDGDSASSTELYALLSRIGGVPLRQDLAVTGSMNQGGEIQPIGGVNEKIEGFYRVCLEVGLTGTQGVLIPRSNVRNLALHGDVVQAVQEGKFHVYPVQTVEEGLELLTGLPAGSPGEEGTVMGIVDQALEDMAKNLKQFGSVEKNNGSTESDDEPSGS